MSLVAISASRTVPVAEDLTTEVQTLSIIRGLEKMHRVDRKTGSGVALAEGEWAVLNDDQTLSRPGATPKANTYLVFAGTNRFDSHATGQATILMGGGLVVKSSRYDAGQSYAVGDGLTAKDLGGGEAYLTKAGGGEAVLARVTAVPAAGVIEYETVRS